MSNRRPILFAVLVIAAILSAGSAPNSGAAAPVAPGFHPAVLMPGSDPGGNEPSLAINTTGMRYVSWQSPGEFAGSPDGFTFTPLKQPDSSTSGDVTNAVSYSGALYNAQICAIGEPTSLDTCFYRSLDGGQTWTQTSNFANMHPGAADRPWITVYPKENTTPTASDYKHDVLYLEFHTFSPDDLVYVTVSKNGGDSWSTPAIIESDTNARMASGCNTIPGGITVDQATGNVYALWLSGNDTQSNVVTGCNYSQIGPFNKAWVSVSKDQGSTWTSHLAWQGDFNTTTKIGDNADKIFSTITVDSAHQVHIALSVRHEDDPVGFVADCETNPDCEEDPKSADLYLVTSPDEAQHWTQPFKINKTDGSYFFPWLAAGSAGNVDATYYSSSTLQPNKPTSIWYIGFSQITGAVATYTTGDHAEYTATPVATDEILLDPNPIHGNGTEDGGVCTFGLFCEAVPNANRDLADVFEVQLDPAGGGNVAWTSDVPAGTGARKVFFACQTSGPSALAGAPDLNGCYGPTDMSITKTGPSGTVLQGQNISYRLAVANNGTTAGPATTSGVTVTDTLPAGTTLISATPSTGSCSGTAVVTCDLGIFPGGATATIDVVVRVEPGTAVGTLTNTATVFSATTDPDTANNTATVTNTVVFTADLALTKIDDPDPVTEQGEISYALTITNSGPSRAESVRVRDPLPPGMTFVSAATSQGTCSHASRIVTCPLGAISSGASATISIVARPTQPGATSNTATVTSPTEDPDTSNNSATADTFVNPQPKCPGFELAPGNHIVGTAAAETLVGTAGIDVICGNDGNDTIQGLGGNDLLLGGGDDDEIVGGQGSDQARGGNGKDSLNGGPGNDRMGGGPDDDILEGGVGADQVRGRQGNDDVNGGDGRDILGGGGGGDVLDGGQDGDVLHGKDAIRGNDVLDGGPGRDTCGADPKDVVRAC